ncbi:MAG: hypothetical protein O3A00_07730 [Planctomycetota bacterium]|nr:hypothetical protein [Planctomycetota bacterium]
MRSSSPIVIMTLAAMAIQAVGYTTCCCDGVPSANDGTPTDSQPMLKVGGGCPHCRTEPPAADHNDRLNAARHCDCIRNAMADWLPHRTTPVLPFDLIAEPKPRRDTDAAHASSTDLTTDLSASVTFKRHLRLCRWLC